MGVKNSVFASKSERYFYYDKLQRTWGHKYNIWHNLPYLNIFTTDNIIDISDYTSRVCLAVLGYGESIKSSFVKLISISEKEKNILKKTSIDYTICNQKDEPILCIEFDGLGEGFNTSLEYHTQKNGVPKYRKPWMELKLKVAHGSYIPYFVVGSKQFNELHEEAKLTAVDAIIGKVMAHQEFDRRKKKLETNPATELGISEEEYEKLFDWEQHELIQDWVFSTEIETDFEYNPIQKQLALLQKELSAWKTSSEWNYIPAIEANISQKERIRKTQEAIWVIVTTYTQSSNPYLKAEQATIRLPNFQIPHLGMPEIIAEEMAELIALLKMKSQNS
ncbi:hypothetical protein [Nostoc parmelioides]|uniref:Uncharacterized protein n=1 Tax=Nostoc parmelioides FACHB-3921 TaxID=2692909 RepID=A0ABR8BG04_9NOSO|nr:hypothetical protein [Nostoc parmelioides]MBD2252705.1 hypothetical protein [Nostoc parmelioides FACHB-3921]